MSDLLASIQQGLGLKFELSSKGTIGIARVTGKVKSRYVVRIELNFLLPSANKIRCRDKVSTHGNQHLVIFISLFYGKCAIITARAHFMPFQILRTKELLLSLFTMLLK